MRHDVMGLAREILMNDKDAHLLFLGSRPASRPEMPRLGSETGTRIRMMSFQYFIIDLATCAERPSAFPVAVAWLITFLLRKGGAQRLVLDVVLLP